MTLAEFLNELREHGFHIGDGTGDSCSGTDADAEEKAAAEIYRAMGVAQRPSRDPKVDPRPGDELAGQVIKAKVLTVTFGEGGITAVEYTVAWVNGEYDRRHSCKVTLEDWKRFVRSENVKVLRAMEPKEA